LARIVLNTFGSLGDLNPYLAVAIELRQRGHNAVVATSAVYRGKVEAEGVEFAAVRPDVGELLDNDEFLRKLWDPIRGTEFLFRNYLLPAVEDSYHDLLAACEGADLLLTHFAGCAGPVVGDSQNLRWLSVALQPTVFLSAADPPVMPVAPWLRHLYPLGVFPLMRKLGSIQFGKWAEPLLALRRRLSLPGRQSPMFEGQFSRLGTLALFSRQFAAPQRDWPPHTTITGFVFYDKKGAGLPESKTAVSDLKRFLESESTPIVFTLGSSAVMQPGQFFQESAEAARHLGRRAVLVMGTIPETAGTIAGDGSVFVADYAPFSELMPGAAAIVHQGGIGTTAQALRAGKPMLVVPWSHDQPDNANRLQRLGVARTIARRRYRAKRVARELELLLSDDSYSRRAAEVGAGVAAENGTQAACDQIVRALG
jgi:UDP:flavonoid glycosyltransferase YjiC (YdhE family)